VNAECLCFLAHQPVWNGADAAACRNKLQHHFRSLDISMVPWAAIGRHQKLRKDIKPFWWYGISE
jgi:hypothetical protein